MRSEKAESQKLRLRLRLGSGRLGGSGRTGHRRNGRGLRWRRRLLLVLFLLLVAQAGFFGRSGVLFLFLAGGVAGEAEGRGLGLTVGDFAGIGSDGGGRVLLHEALRAQRLGRFGSPGAIAEAGFLILRGSRFERVGRLVGLGYLGDGAGVLGRRILGRTGKSLGGRLAVADLFLFAGLHAGDFRGLGFFGLLGLCRRRRCGSLGGLGGLGGLVAEGVSGFAETGPFDLVLFR